MSWNPPIFESALDVFAQRQRSGLLRSQHIVWVNRTQYYLDCLMPFTLAGQFPRILLAQRDPIDFLAGFMAACMTECPVFLGNSNWSRQEWQQVLDLTQPHQIWGNLPILAEVQPPDTTDATQRGWIMIPTGGSSGGIKFAIHTWQTLSASVLGFQAFFCHGLPIHSCCVLPLYHVSGLMQFLRSFLTNGQLIILPFAELLSGQSAQSDAANFLQQDCPEPADFFLSLVPTQLQRLLEGRSRIQWIQQFHTILLGGAPAWASLLEQAKVLQLNLALTYGMTETASQVATLKPHEFLQGHLGTGCVLPHAKVTIQDTKGLALESRQAGTIAIQAPSLFQGYYPQCFPTNIWISDDVGYLDPQRYLFVLGRNSRKILSGGENIFPEEIEAALYATGLVREACVLGMADEQWGEAVTALYVPIETQTPETLKTALDESLSRYKHPKRWICVEKLPRSAQGKLDYSFLSKWVETLSQTQGDP
jgi:O-succinylbenzoic acid--CoA ligase